MSEFGDITADRPLLLVGGGRMGSALLSGWLFDSLDKGRVAVVEPDRASADRLAETYRGMIVVPSPDRLVARPSVVVLAVKPQVMDSVLPSLAHYGDSLFLSIAAGRTIASFTTVLGNHAAIVRAMPNTPAAIGRGMSVCVANALVSAAQRQICTGLLQAVGDVAWIDKEAQMDAVTALSGSGPAYVFHLIEAMAAAGQALGLDEALAEKLARQTVIGAGALVDESSDAPSVLRQNVTSPGGTTEAALDVLMAEGGLVALMRTAMDAAAKRSKDLSG